MNRISLEESLHGGAILDDLWSVVDIIEIDDELMRNAADLARTHGLRGYDATHCAAAISVDDDQLVAATGDRRLLSAWQAEGVSTWNPNS